MISSQIESLAIMVRKCESTLLTDFHLSAQDFIEQFVAFAPQCALNGCIFSVMYAQMCIESARGSKKPLFGMKATEADFQAGKAYAVPTHEVVNGLLVPSTQYFFNANSIEDYINNYFEYIKRMKPNAPIDDIPAFIGYLLREPAYNPNLNNAYYSEVLSIIKNDQATAFDS